MKKLIILLICIALMLCGCDTQLGSQSVLGAYGSSGESESSEKSIKLTDLTMLYYGDMDDNPATTSALANHELLKFVYSPLITVNAGFEPICILAENWKLDGAVATVKLRSDIYFSNGEQVTAYDVVKSFNAVKNSPTSPYYQSILLMKRYYASNSLTFVCEFKSADVDALATLDIPIMYNGQAGFGCGPYVFSEQNGKAVLKPNEKYFETPSVPIIHLAETKNDEYIDDLFSSGALDIMIASAVEGQSLTSLRDYQIVSCPSNRFVYIGVSFANEKLASVDVRRAISTIIDRAKLTEQSLAGLASPTKYPFNPEWSKMKNAGLDKTDPRTDSEILAAAALLKDIPLTLTVPDSSYKASIAAVVAECFKDAGLTLEIKTLDSDAYTAAVTSGQFDLYLGETAISRNMDPTFLYSTGGSLNYSGFSNAELDAAFDSYKRGDSTLLQYCSEFDKQLPIIPVMFSKNVLYCAQGIAGFAERSAFNIYGNGARIKLK